MMDAILKEIDLRKNFLEEDIHSIYFGGGTPSLIQAQYINQIINQIGKYYNLNKVKEITLEANPEDITPDKIAIWQAAGVNRYSLGIQTFDDAVLLELNRSHSGQEALDAVKLIRSSGIENITIDLMYGLPNQDSETWEKNLSKIISLDIPHISAYALTIEKQTVLGHREEKGIIKPLPDDLYEEQYQVMCNSLHSAGYEHYEVSNFAKKSYRSQHNQLYWQGVSYLGIGPGAHSYNGNERVINVSNNPGYIRAVNNEILPTEVEVLSQDQKYNEYILTGLRTSSGIDLKKLKAEFQKDLAKEHSKYLGQCVSNKLAYFDNEIFTLTEKGFFVSDAIILELMK